MTLNLIKFPLEILLHICELLNHIHEPSLRSFALSNKYCYSVACGLLFRSLTFNITTPSRLRTHVRKCSRLLQRDDAFHHVRRVVLVGDNHFRMASQDNDEHSDDVENADLPDCYRWQLGPAPSIDWDINHQRLLGLPDHSDYNWNAWFSGRIRLDAAYDEDATWSPLADLLGQLPALVDLIYECPTQFPRCLLKALETKTQNQTRLHIRTFKLRMLEGPSSTQTIARDSYELALIKSPCIHSIWLSDYYSERATPNQEGRSILLGGQLDTLEQMMRTEGFVPNLREVHIWHRPPFFGDEIQPRPHPSGWLPEHLGAGREKQQPMALDHLELGGGRELQHITGIQLRHWIELADLSALRTLELTAFVVESSLDILLSLQFPALRNLTFGCMKNPTPGYFEKVKRFLVSLPRLKSLSVRGWDWSVAPLAPDLDKTTNTNYINPACCKSLQTLWLDHQSNVFSPTSRSSLIYPAEIAGLGLFCPRVETLSLSIRRSKSDADEAARYKAIAANFPKLKRVALTLDASPPFRELISRRPDEVVPFEDQYAGRWGYTHGHFMNVMVNSAVDKKLVRQIWEAVASPGLEIMMVRAQGGTDFKRPPGLLPTGVNLGGFPVLGSLLNGLAREWVVDTINSKGEASVKEIGGNAEGWNGRDLALQTFSMEPVSQYFRTLWPEAKVGSRGRYEDWESWPLAGASVGGMGHQES
ncbi:hypothetical protein QBC40DRAFT_274637 [Triangularia verruculosa]|uniref:Uncharacterized protein n=1 Tax=Triangularia verruculosa TaxID=2587418 RepID=A0AAN6XNK0_9PEZI|nr:hypothetical protein QBC40DRAFT_274637 [Triangularia verruculosa]